MYRWPWLERQLRARPVLALLMSLALLALCVWILVTSPSDRGSRTGLPMWLLAGFLAVMMLLAVLRALQRIVSSRRKESDLES